MVLALVLMKGQHIVCQMKQEEGIFSTLPFYVGKSAAVNL